MGIDVSHYQGEVNWPEVQAAGNSFAFCKATEGSTFTDAQFATNMNGLSAAGMLRGAYHFFHVNDDPAVQAAYFLAATAPYSMDLPLCLDLEDQVGLAQVGAAQMRDNVNAFVSAVEAGRAGRMMVIYGSSYYLSLLDGGYSGHPLWLAQYTSDAEPYALPSGWDAWTFWQYTSSGSVPGVAGGVDLDHFNGDAAALAAWCETH